MKLRLLFLLLPLAVVPGCQTTGDPNSGGLFWSEDKARQRLHQQHQRLDNLQSQGEQLKAESEALENALQRQNRILGP